MTATSPAAGESIVLITHEFYPKRGGIATFSEEIARATARLGYNIEVWAQAAPGVPEKTDWPFRLRRLPLAGTHDLRCQWRLTRELVRNRRRLRDTIVYVPEPGPMLALMLLQFVPHWQPRRLVLTFHGSEVLKFARNPVRRWLAGRLLGRVTRISTPSQYTRELLLRHFRQAADKTVLTPGALRTECATTAARVAAGAALSVASPVVGPNVGRVSNQKVIVLTVGRLHARKGQLVTLQALQSLPAAVRTQLEYWVVGVQSKGGYEARLRAAAAAQPEPAVHFFGDLPDDELTSVYQRADVFAMTSVNLAQSVEGFGLVYLEASAHGLPVVAHDVGGVAEAVVDGVTGLLVPPNRPVELAAAFERLIRDPELRRTLGAAGREWSSRHCWQKSAQTLFNFAQSG